MCIIHSPIFAGHLSIYLSIYGKTDGRKRLNFRRRRDGILLNLIKTPQEIISEPSAFETLRPPAACPVEPVFFFML
jgi:hypothetical protein